MRRVLLLACILPLVGCSSIRLFPKKPKVTFSPEIADLKLQGRASMQSVSSGTVINNPRISLGTSLNLSDRDNAYGGRLSYGDGFAGIGFRFIQFSENAVKTTGTVEDNFGTLRPGDKVRSEFRWNNYAFDYLVNLYETKKWIPKTLLRFGAGISIQHNDGAVEAISQFTPHQQTISFQDDFGIPMLLLRAEGEYKPVKVRLNIGLSHGNYGGFNGDFLDLRLSGQYKIQRGISAYAGFWHYNFPAEGSKDGLAFDFSSSIEGFFAGLRFDI